MNMKRSLSLALLAIAGSTGIVSASDQHAQGDAQISSLSVIQLPAISPDGAKPLERAIMERRSMREFRENAPVALSDIAHLLWAAQGRTSDDGKRTVPSAGALYPLETYLMAEHVTGLKPGIYRYLPLSHELASLRSGPVLMQVVKAALNQDWMEKAGAVIIIAADYSRTAIKYGNRAERYVHIEAGHAAQNVCLEVLALNLGTTVVGAFDDKKLAGVLGLPAAQSPLVILPIGRPPGG